MSPQAPADADAAGLIANQAATQAAREAYGRMLALLAWQWRDIAAAEDALSDAFAAALVHWPRSGVPASPQAWLLTAARRHLLKAARRRRQSEDPTVTILFAGSEQPAPTPPAVPDHRLRLMFVCAHPAIEPKVHSALMLQIVLGIDATRIARAFVVSTEAMTKRLVRAKAKIKATGLRFEEPQAGDLKNRIDAVLDAIYGAYTLHDMPDPAQALNAASTSLAEEAVYLAELVAAQLPDDAEATGLLALLLLCEARRPARFDAAGGFVPLDQHDPGRWNAAAIDRANALIAQAAGRRQPGPFQIEAAIQAAHCHRRHGGATPWSDIVHLYERLIQWYPGAGARIGHAIAFVQAGGAVEEGLRLLHAIDVKALEHHQPWWAAKAHLLAELPQCTDEAIEAFARARSLSTAPSLLHHFDERLQALRGRLH